jgi:hypothetical protein
MVGDGAMQWIIHYGGGRKERLNEPRPFRDALGNEQPAHILQVWDDGSLAAIGVKRVKPEATPPGTKPIPNNGYSFKPI